MTNELEPQGENNLVELTPDQIQALDIPSRPGYLGEDDEGPYKVDIYGRRRRPFQKGGPSPNYKGRGLNLNVCDFPAVICTKRMCVLDTMWTASKAPWFPATKIHVSAA